MAFSSFYGGRQGASFVIVKRFDAVSVEENTVYKEVEYAVNQDGYFIYNDDFIEKNGSNYNLYAWERVRLNGDTVNTINSQGVISQQVLSIAYKEGMVQCFKRGGDSTDIVNYGEYVIIDSEDPDNGKVYRRGMNYDYDPVTNPLAGAEYIGQIVGPQGEIPAVNVNSESVVQTYVGYREGSYTLSNEGIVPGQYVEGYEEAIFLGTYVNNAVTEILNNVSNPQEDTLYSVLNGGTQVYEYYTWTSAHGWHQESATYNDGITYSWVNVRDKNDQYYGALIGFTFPYLVESFTATAVSAYYHRDSQGVPFRNMNLIERIDDGSHPFYQSWRIKVPEGIKGDTVTKIEIIDTEALKGASYYSDQLLTNEIGTLSNNVSLNTDNIDYTQNYIPIVLNGTTYYVANDENSIGKSILRYISTNYDKSAAGENTFVPIGPYNTVKNIEIVSNGDVYVDYTYKGRVKLDSSSLKWISNVSIDGRDGNGTQKVNITYNNNTTEEIGQPLNYILEAVVTESRSETPLTPPFHLLVLYSDPVRRAAIVADHKNAIYRSIYPDSNGAYIRNDWYDLGNVRGAEGGLGVLTKLANVNLLNDDSSSHVPIPPEYMLYAVSQRNSSGSYMYNPPQGLDSQYAGWLVAVNTATALEPDAADIYFYDYSSNTWNKISGIGGGGGASDTDHITVVAYDPNISPSDSLSKKLYDITYMGTGIELTQAEYDALTPAEKLNGNIYFVTDAVDPSAVTVDAALSTTSENPVQNKVITGRFANGKIAFEADNNNDYYYKKDGDDTLYSLGVKITNVDPGEDSALSKGSILVVLE